MIGAPEECRRLRRQSRRRRDYRGGTNRLCQRRRVGGALRHGSAGRVADRPRSPFRPAPHAETRGTDHRRQGHRRRAQPGRPDRAPADRRHRDSGRPGHCPTAVGAKSSLTGWIAALEQIRPPQPAIIVPGHGPIDRDDQQLQLMEGLFTSIEDQVAGGVARGDTLDEEHARDAGRRRGRFAGSSQLRAFLFDYYVTGPRWPSVPEYDDEVGFLPVLIHPGCASVVRARDDVRVLVVRC